MSDRLLADRGVLVRYRGKEKRACRKLAREQMMKNGSHDSAFHPGNNRASAHITLSAVLFVRLQADWK